MPGMFKPNVEKMKEKKDVDGLAKALKHKDVAIRRSAAEALGNIRDGRAVEPLVQALNDEDTAVRGNAAYALGYLGDRRAIEPLVHILKHMDKDDRRKATNALAEIKDAGTIEPLMEALNDEDSSLHWSAAHALGRSEDPRAFEALIQALKNRDARQVAAHALQEKKDPRAVEPLIEALKDEAAGQQSHYAVGALIGALARTGDLRAAEPIIDSLLMFRTELDFLSSDSKYDLWALKSMFGDYSDPILETSLLKRKKQKMTIVDDGRRVASYIDRKEVLDFEGSTEAFSKLCKVATPISNNILHAISRKKDISRSADERARSFFTSQSEKAREELKRRGDPPYDPSIYLKKEAWKL